MPDADFERTFADLAHANLRDRAPILLDYLVGFQMLDKNDEGTRAVGVWGFKVGDEWMYAPVFFLNGQLKGQELLYLKSQDSFVPLKENWINYLLNRKPRILGELEEQAPGELGIRQPDFDAIARPPFSGSKAASAGDVRNLVDYLTARVSSEFRPFLPVALDPPSSGKRASLRSKWHLPNFLKSANKQMALNLVHTMRNNTKFADAILQFYTMDEIIKAAEETRGNSPVPLRPVHYPGLSDRVIVMADGDSKGKHGTITSIDRKQLSVETIDEDKTQTRKERETISVNVKLDDGSVFTTERPERDLVEEPPKLEKPAAEGDKYITGSAPKVKVILADRIDPNSLDTALLSDEERRKLQRDRYVVIDDRTDKETSMVYRKELPATYSGPTRNGWQRVLMADGSLKDMLVITNPVGRRRKDTNAVIVDLDNGNRLYIAPTNSIFVSDEAVDNSAWQSRYDKLASATSAGRGDKILLVNQYADALAPFFVTMKVTSADGQTQYYGSFDNTPRIGDDKTYKVRFPKFRGRHFNPSDVPNAVDITYQDETRTTIVITDKPGTQIVVFGSTYFVPASYKLIKINSKDVDYWLKRDLNDPMSMFGKQRPASLQPATLSTVVNMRYMVTKSASTRSIKVISDGIEFRLRVDGEQSRPFSKIAALQELVINYGLREADALELLKQANRDGSEYIIRLPENLVKQAQGEYSPVAPYIPEPMVGTDPQLGVPMQYPQAEGLNAGAGPYARPTPMDMDATFRAQQAAQQGQKEVLDTSVIAGLVKTMDPDQAVNQYLGDLLLGLDRLGRLLFLYYWHYDKFKERYGSRDMPELEDNLRNVFDNLGDLVLFLKQKTVEPEISGATAEAELSEVL